MRIVLLTGELSTSAGGLAGSLPGMAASLERHSDIDVHIVGAQDPRKPEEWRDWGRQVHPLKIYGPRAFHWMPSLEGALGRLDPEVVDVQGIWTYPSLASLQYFRTTRRPYLVTPHGMLDPWAVRNARWKKRLASAWFESRHLRNAACLRATAQMEADHLRSYGLSQPIAIIPNGVDVPSQSARSGESRDFRRLLFLGRLHPKKGLPYLLRAWARLAQAHPDWELVIAGMDELDHKRDMQKLQAELGAGRVTWMEPVFGEAKAELYRTSDLFVLPTHAENFGMVVAEALAYGVPVVTTRHAPWSGLQEHNCGWWIDLSADALAEALSEAMRLPDEALRAMGDRGRAWMEQDFGWPSIARKLADVYRWVSAGGPKPSCVQLA